MVSTLGMGKVGATRRWRAGGSAGAGCPRNAAATASAMAEPPYRIGDAGAQKICRGTVKDSTYRAASSCIVTRAPHSTLNCCRCCDKAGEDEEAAPAPPRPAQQQHHRLTRAHGTAHAAPARHAAATQHVSTTMTHSNACVCSADSGGKSATKRASSAGAGDGDDDGVATGRALLLLLRSICCCCRTDRGGRPSGR
jgi:hypothetical protein